MGHTHSINEEIAFLEQEMKYIAETAPGNAGNRAGTARGRA